MVYIANAIKNLLMNHCPECLDIWYGTSYGQGDSRQLGYFKYFIIANTKCYASLYVYMSQLIRYSRTCNLYIDLSC